MTDVQIHGTEQVQPGSITDASVSTTAAIALSKIAGSAGIILANGTVGMAAAFNAGSNLINNLANGIASTDATTLGQVNALIAAAVTAGVTPVSFQGVYSSATAYSINQVVSYSGSLYICIQAGTGEEPDISPLYWSLIYTGIPGAAGVAGVRGSYIYVASGAPGAVSGQLNGDIYIDSSTAKLYQLVAGVWTYYFTLTGGGGATYSGTAPIVVAGSNISINQASTTQLGAMQAGAGLAAAAGVISLSTFSGLGSTFYNPSAITVGNDGRVSSAVGGSGTIDIVSGSGYMPLSGPATTPPNVIFVGSGAAQFYLPSIAGYLGQKILIKNMTTYTVTIYGTAGPELIDGAATYILSTQYQFVELLAIEVGTTYSWAIIGAGSV